MIHPRKWRKIVLLVTGAAIACQASASALVRTRRVHAYLTAHLERAFGRPVEVGHFGAGIFPSPRLDVDAITVGEDPAFGYEYFLRAEHMTAGLRWAGLLRGRFEFGTLSLTRPSLILVRNAQGRWNLAQWLPPAKANAATGRIYGPPLPVAPVNHLRKIEIDEGRVNFKNVADKAPFAFTGVSGNVEQVSPGRWELHLEAQPWRSGVELQSAGTVQVRGDLAGTSARLQPAELSVHWERVSLADFFRLLRGEDYGVRGAFALDVTAKSGAPSPGASVNPDGESTAGTWSLSLGARAEKIHRWDLAERADNPALNLRWNGTWNPSTGKVAGEALNVEAPQSNLRGSASFHSEAAPGFELRVDSAGIQATDLLAWYRAFHPDVADGVAAQQYFTGMLRLRGWPIVCEEAAFSSRGGAVRVPGFAEPIRVDAVAGGGNMGKLTLEPVRIFLNERNKAAVTPLLEKKRGASDLRNAVDIGLEENFETQSGAVTIDGRIDKAEDLLRITSAFGRQLNHGWEVSGGASAALRWEWKNSWHGLWNGRVDFTGARVQAAGLNQPLKFEGANIEWKDGKRSAQIAKASGFGASWSGEISEAQIENTGNQPNWNFELHADHLNAADLDRWIGPRARPNWLERLLASLSGSAAQDSAASELLRRINAEGELNIDELTVEKLKLKAVRAEGAVNNLRVEVNRSEAQWAGGTVRAKLQAAFSPRPVYEVTAQVEGLDLAQLPAAAHVAERFSGLASGTAHLTTEGVGREELLQKLAGKGEVRLKNLEFRGWDVGASASDGTPRTGTSRWAVGQGLFALRDRSVLIDKLQLDSPIEQTIVRGTVSFARDAQLTAESMSPGKREAKNAAFSPTAAGAAAHLLKISGPLDGLKLSVASAATRQPAD